MIKVVIFDLDNTLFDTRSIPDSVTGNLFAALRGANMGRDCVPAEVLDQAIEDSWFVPFPIVAAKHGLPQRLLEVWANAQQTLRLPERLLPFSDVIETLKAIHAFKCLLTSGYQRVQWQKIEALGITQLFNLIVIDAVDAQVHLGKEKILSDLMQSRNWKPHEMLIVGDSASSEIVAGIQLGIPTVQILRPGVQRTETADRHIHSLTELL